MSSMTSAQVQDIICRMTPSRLSDGKLVPTYYVAPRPRRGCFTRLADAVRHAAPNSRIEILEGGLFMERLLLTKEVEIGVAAAATQASSSSAAAKNGSGVSERKDAQLQYRTTPLVIATEEPVLVEGLIVSVSSAEASLAGPSHGASHDYMNEGGTLPQPSVLVNAGRPNFVDCQFQSMDVTGTAAPMVRQCRVLGGSGHGLTLSDRAAGHYTHNRIGGHAGYSVAVTASTSIAAAEGGGEGYSSPAEQPLFEHNTIGRSALGHILIQGGSGPLPVAPLFQLNRVGDLVEGASGQHAESRAGGKDARGGKGKGTMAREHGIQPSHELERLAVKEVGDKVPLIPSYTRAALMGGMQQDGVHSLKADAPLTLLASLLGPRYTRLCEEVRGTSSKAATDRKSKAPAATPSSSTPSASSSAAILITGAWARPIFLQNTITACSSSSYAVVLQSRAGGLYRGNQFSSNNGWAVAMLGPSLSSGAAAARSGEGPLFEGNQLRSNYGGGLLVHGDVVAAVKTNVFERNVGPQMFIHTNSDGLVVADNDVVSGEHVGVWWCGMDRTGGGTDAADGRQLRPDDGGGFLEGNRFHGCALGVLLDHGATPRVVGGEFEECMLGVVSQNAASGAVVSCTFAEARVAAALLRGGAMTRVADCEFAHCAMGIVLCGPDASSAATTANGEEAVEPPSPPSEHPSGVIERCRIRSCRSWAVEVGAGATPLVQHCWVVGGQVEGVHLQAGAGGCYQHNVIVGNSGACQVLVEASASLAPSFVANTIGCSAGDGLVLKAGAAGLYSNNIITRCYGAALVVMLSTVRRPQQKPVVRANYLAKCRQHGLLLLVEAPPPPPTPVKTVKILEPGISTAEASATAPPPSLEDAGIFERNVSLCNGVANMCVTLDDGRYGTPLSPSPEPSPERSSAAPSRRKGKGAALASTKVAFDATVMNFSTTGKSDALREGRAPPTAPTYVVTLHENYCFRGRWGGVLVDAIPSDAMVVLRRNTLGEHLVGAVLRGRGTQTAMLQNLCWAAETPTPRRGTGVAARPRPLCGVVGVSVETGATARLYANAIGEGAALVGGAGGNAERTMTAIRVGCEAGSWCDIRWNMLRCCRLGFLLRDVGGGVCGGNIVHGVASPGATTCALRCDGLYVDASSCGMHVVRNVLVQPCLGIGVFMASPTRLAQPAGAAPPPGSLEGNCVRQPFLDGIRLHLPPDPPPQWYSALDAKGRRDGLLRAPCAFLMAYNSILGAAQAGIGVVVALGGRRSYASSEDAKRNYGGGAAAPLPASCGWALLLANVVLCSVTGVRVMVPASSSAGDAFDGTLGGSSERGGSSMARAASSTRPEPLQGKKNGTFGAGHTDSEAASMISCLVARTLVARCHMGCYVVGPPRSRRAPQSSPPAPRRCLVWGSLLLHNDAGCLAVEGPAAAGVFPLQLNASVVAHSSMFGCCCVGPAATGSSPPVLASSTLLDGGGSGAAGALIRGSVLFRNFVNVGVAGGTSPIITGTVCAAPAAINVCVSGTGASPTLDGCTITSSLEAILASSSSSKEPVGGGVDAYVELVDQLRRIGRNDGATHTALPSLWQAWSEGDGSAVTKEDHHLERKSASLYRSSNSLFGDGSHAVPQGVCASNWVPQGSGGPRSSKQWAQAGAPPGLEARGGEKGGTVPEDARQESQQRQMHRTGYVYVCSGLLVSDGATPTVARCCLCDHTYVGINNAGRLAAAAAAPSAPEAPNAFADTMSQLLAGASTSSSDTGALVVGLVFQLRSNHLGFVAEGERTAGVRQLCRELLLLGGDDAAVEEEEGTARAFPLDGSSTMALEGFLGRGLLVVRGGGGQVRDCVFTRNTTGLVLSGGADTGLYSCRFSYHSSVAAIVHREATGTLDHVVFLANHQEGVIVSGAKTGPRLQQCTFAGSVKCSVVCSAQSATELHGNRFLNAQAEDGAVLLRGTDEGTVLDRNTFQSCKKGVQCEAGAKGTLSGNQFMHTAECAVTITDSGMAGMVPSTCPTLRRNTFVQSAEVSIYVAGVGAAPQVLQNQIDGGAVGISLERGAAGCFTQNGMKNCLTAIRLHRSGGVWDQNTVTQAKEVGILLSDRSGQEAAHAQQCATAIFQRTHIHDSDGVGLHLVGTSTSVCVAGCIVERVKGVGCKVEGPKAASSLLYCVFQHCTEGGCVVAGGASPLLAQCLCMANGKAGVTVEGKGSRPHLVRLACVENAGTGIHCGGGAQAQLYHGLVQVTMKGSIGISVEGESTTLLMAETMVLVALREALCGVAVGPGASVVAERCLLMPARLGKLSSGGEPKKKGGARQIVRIASLMHISSSEDGNRVVGCVFVGGGPALALPSTGAVTVVGCAFIGEALTSHAAEEATGGLGAAVALQEVSLHEHESRSGGGGAGGFVPTVSSNGNSVVPVFSHCFFAQYRYGVASSTARPGKLLHCVFSQCNCAVEAHGPVSLYMCEIAGCPTGLRALSHARLSVLRCYLWGSTRAGIQLSQESDATLEECVVWMCQRGLVLDGSAGGHVQRCRLCANNSGVVIAEKASTKLSDNLIFDATHTGLLLNSSAATCRLSQNSVFDCKFASVVLPPPSASGDSGGSLAAAMEQNLFAFPKDGGAVVARVAGKTPEGGGGGEDEGWQSIPATFSTVMSTALNSSNTVRNAFTPPASTMHLKPIPDRQQVYRRLELEREQGILSRAAAAVREFAEGVLQSTLQRAGQGVAEADWLAAGRVVAHPVLLRAVRSAAAAMRGAAAEGQTEVTGDSAADEASTADATLQWSQRWSAKLLLPGAAMEEIATPFERQIAAVALALCEEGSLSKEATPPAALPATPERVDAMSEVKKTLLAAVATLVPAYPWTAQASVNAGGGSTAYAALLATGCTPTEPILTLCSVEDAAGLSDAALLTGDRSIWEEVRKRAAEVLAGIAPHLSVPLTTEKGSRGAEKRAKVAPRQKVEEPTESLPPVVPRQKSRRSTVMAARRKSGRAGSIASRASLLPSHPSGKRPTLRKKSLAASNADGTVALPPIQRAGKTAKSLSTSTATQAAKQRSSTV